MQARILMLIVVALLAVSGFFLWPSIIEYATTGHVSLHWSRLLAGTFSLLSALQTAVFALLLKVLTVWKEQQAQSESIVTTSQSDNRCTKNELLPTSAS